MITKSTFLNMLCGGLMALWCASGQAHEGADSLGPALTATDYFTIDCDDDGNGAPEHLLFQVTGGFPATGPLVSAQIQVPDKQIAVSVTDPVSGDRASSREVLVRGGDSTYHVTVNKIGAGKMTYSFVFHCETASGAHTGTSAPKPRQIQ